MTIEANFRRFLMDDAAVLAAVGGSTVTARIHLNHIPQHSDQTGTRIFFQRRGRERLRTLNSGGAGTLSRHLFDVECIAVSPGDAITAAEAVRARLESAGGTFGTTTVQAITVEDHNDDYIPRGLGHDSGHHVAALDVTVFHST